MYTQRAPRGESYTIIVSRVGRGTEAMCAKYRRIKANHVPAALSQPSGNRVKRERAGAGELERWSTGVWVYGRQRSLSSPSVCHSLSPIQTKYDTPRLQTHSQRLRGRDTSVSCLSSHGFFLESKGEETEREESAPICSHPHPPWLSISKDDAGIHMPARRQIPRRMCH